MARAARHIVSFVLAAAVLPVVLSGHAEAQTGESVIAWHVTIAPSWFDPSTAPAQITPFGILYALHDSVVRVEDRRSTRLNSTHATIAYTDFCSKKKKQTVR